MLYTNSMTHFLTHCLALYYYHHYYLLYSPPGTVLENCYYHSERAGLAVFPILYLSMASRRRFAVCDLRWRHGCSLDGLHMHACMKDGRMDGWMDDTSRAIAAFDFIFSAAASVRAMYTS